MDTAASYLIGSHDFSSFVPAALPGSRERRMDSARCWRGGDLVTVELQGSGFMRQMVRSIVGTLLLVGHGKCEPAVVRDILTARDRDLGGMTAPACGLYLYDVHYAAEDGSTISQEME
jgi:tRNA pseudouridine38-40 synthase